MLLIALDLLSGLLTNQNHSHHSRSLMSRLDIVSLIVSFLLPTSIAVSLELEMLSGPRGLFQP